MTYKKIAAAALLTVALAGCQSVVASNPSSVLVQYDPGMYDPAKMAAMAQEECQKHGKNAVYTSTIPTNGFSLPTASFRCEK
ncbi:hypothetical protein [Roseibium sp.]|uniref:hypothetical protein n=1 Tax=Roseibium sp. TaxID=1936156 RepID=UPI003D0D92BE